MRPKKSLKALDEELLGQRLPGSQEVRNVFLGWLQEMLDEKGESYIRQIRGFLLAEAESLQYEVAGLPPLTFNQLVEQRRGLVPSPTFYNHLVFWAREVGDDRLEASVDLSQTPKKTDNDKVKSGGLAR